MIRTILLSFAALLALTASMSAQSAVHCCLQTWTPAQVIENERVMRAFHQMQADSPECKRDGIGCPEHLNPGDEAPSVKQKSITELQRDGDEAWAYACKLHHAEFCRRRR